MQPDAAFSCTIYAGQTTTSRGTVCIVFICLTTQIMESKRSAWPYRTSHIDEITTPLSLNSGRNMNCWIFLHYLDNVHIEFPAGRSAWNWTIWLGEVQQKYKTGKDEIYPRKLFLGSFSSLQVYWTQIAWGTGINPWLALEYSLSQWSPWRLTEVRLWNGVK